MSKKIELSCLSCGGRNYEIEREKSIEKAPYGPAIEKEDEVFKCNTCGAEFDLEDMTGESKITAYQESKNQSVQKMINYLAQHDYDLAGIERALELPQRTLSRWKSSSKTSAIGITLLRVLRTFPWIIDVAENKFESRTTNMVYLSSALQKLIELNMNIGVIPHQPSEKLRVDIRIFNIDIQGKTASMTLTDGDKPDEETTTEKPHLLRAT